MYNEQIKNAFIAKYTKSAQTKTLLLHIFDRTMAVEEKYGVDFYAMNVEQAQEAFNCVSGIKVSGASTILMILKAYVRWCAANGYRASKAVQELRIDVYDKLRESYVASPRHLLYTLNAAFPNPEDNEIEYVYRSFLWLGFIGLQVCEAIRITPEDINLKELTLTCPIVKPKEPPETPRIFAIYPEAVPDLRKAVELKEFKEPRGKDGVKKPRASGNEILRGKESKRTLEEAIEATFRPTISRAFKAALDKYEKTGTAIPAELSLKITYKHVYLSGVFYRTYERERIGFPIRFDEIVLGERRNAKEPSFSRNYTERKLLNILIRNMEQDYENWKSVFT